MGNWYTDEPLSTIQLRHLTFSPAQFANVRKINGVSTPFLRIHGVWMLNIPIFSWKLGPAKSLKYTLSSRNLERCSMRVMYHIEWGGQGPMSIMFIDQRFCACAAIESRIHVYCRPIDRKLYHGHVIQPLAFKSSLAVVYWTLLHTWALIPQ